MTATQHSIPAEQAVPRKKLHVMTWGCQMNVYDSGRMTDVLAPLGYAPSDTAEGADMVILNDVKRLVESLKHAHPPERGYPLNRFARRSRQFASKVFSLIEA